MTGIRRRRWRRKVVLCGSSHWAGAFRLLAMFSGGVFDVFFFPGCIPIFISQIKSYDLVLPPYAILLYARCCSLRSTSTGLLSQWEFRSVYIIEAKPKQDLGTLVICG